MNLYIFNEKRRGSEYGVGTYIHELTVALRESCINVCIVNLASERPQIQTETIDGVMYWYFPLAISDQRTSSNDRQWELYFHNIVYLLRLHIKDKNNLIFHLNYCQSAILAEKLKNAFKCKVIAVSHFSEWSFKIFDNLPRLRNILDDDGKQDIFGEEIKKAFEEEKKYYTKVDHVICLSHYMKDVLCRDYGLKSTKISIIPNALSDIVETSINTEQLRKKWNIQEKEKIILYAGRIDDIKGVVYLIKAFHKVVLDYPNSRLIIVGTGDYDRCFKEAKKISTKITFTGFLCKKDLYELYRIAFMGVIPSLFEPFGYVAIEMMMYGIPVVVTKTSGLNEVVEKTCGLKTPLIISSDNNVEIDINLLSDNILYLLQHPVEAKQMGENGRKRYLENYSSKIFSKNMLHLYESIHF